jgi:hypothetical protein
MTEQSEASVLVLNARPLWIRLLFRELGKFVPTTGVTFRFSPDDAPVTEHDLVEAPGWRLASVDLPKKSFGRLAALYAPWLYRKLKKRFGRPSVVVFTQPCQRFLCRYFAGARRIYYVADDYRWDYGWDPRSVEAWERGIADNVEHIVCVSDALANSMVERLGLNREQMFVSANGMPASVIPGDRPCDHEFSPVMALPDTRPLAGVFGTINRRIRLDWLRDLVDALPWLNLLLVGPKRDLSDGQLDDWRYLAGHARCTIVGQVEYYELFRYAARVEIGLIPLNSEGINPASSPTRFYTQLPFGQPIVASEGSLQLRDFVPLVTIATTCIDFIREVEALYLAGFDDHLADRRRAAAREHTWERRAESFFQELICR